ncbi:MAG: hypothetical protein HW407_2341, partial [Bacteroidetes bacterium]|nr:hypothetical protein [Bacteroidota bacterium]
MGQLGEIALVGGAAGTLEVETSDLPLQRSHRTVALDALNFVKGTV